MSERYSRQLSLLGDNSPALLSKKTVMICGLGGVGGYVLEALVRVGIGSFILIDNDCFDQSNLNRQLLATTANIGKKKTVIAKERVLLINPDAICVAADVFLDKNNVPELLQKYRPDYVADAIDFVEAKVALAKHCESLGIPLIASMGTGNKLDPTAFECTDIYKTSTCPLARSMRKRLKDEGVSHLKVVYSKEPAKPSGQVVNSVSFVPSTAGMIIAGEIIKDLCNIDS
ncbi:MAG: tRNA threonylcarbamoyladenosine dehydratase [Ruminococcaceae bacterium]|nr:tRNA threonylcarbamoyladenosine dehydratase [Oscillospiraceae bacterium]